MKFITQTLKKVFLFRKILYLGYFFYFLLEIPGYSLNTLNTQTLRHWFGVY